MKLFSLICCLSTGAIVTNAVAQEGMNDLEIAHSAYTAGVKVSDVSAYGSN